MYRYVSLSIYVYVTITIIITKTYKIHKTKYYIE